MKKIITQLNHNDTKTILWKTLVYRTYFISNFSIPQYFVIKINKIKSNINKQTEVSNKFLAVYPVTIVAVAGF